MPKAMIHTLEELKDLQALPLDFKVAMTRDRITEFYERMEGKVYVAFSGGKDSTVLLHIARSIYPDIKAVYANTGIDFPSVVKFIKSFDNVDYVQPNMRFATIIKKHGIVFPSKDASRVLKDARRGCQYAVMALAGKNVKGEEDSYKKRFVPLKKYLDVDVPISDVCCELLKEKPMRDYEKATGLRPITAIMAVESSRRTLAWLTKGCNILDGGNERSKPMSFWTEQDVLKYIVDSHVPIADVYGDVCSMGLLEKKYWTTGEKRTGCMFCAVPLAHGENRLPSVKKRCPKMYDTFINKLGLGEMFRKLGLDYER